MIEKAERIARAWMPGVRQGIERRPAWKHPEDLVALLTELLGPAPTPAPSDRGPPRYAGDGTDLTALEHLADAQDFYFEREHWREIMSIAWLHDIIEDGVTPGGRKVTANDLWGEKFSPEIIAGVVWLTHKEGEPKSAYLERIHGAPPKVQLVKLVDRICNLREGKGTFKDARWARYVRETEDFIIPMLWTLGAEFAHLQPKLKALMTEAVAGRLVVD
jgi:hypothetical protein